MPQSSSSSSSSIFVLFILPFLFSALVFSQPQPQPQPLLDATEQEALYEVLSAVNPDIPWRTLFPDDLCLSAPHGVVCDFFVSSPPSSNDTVSQSAHVSQLSFGYVSDYTPNPPCSPNATLSPLLFSSFPFLRKLFFYSCFTQSPVSFPNVSSSSVANTLEELVFIQNPALVGPLRGDFGNFTNLRRLVLTGNGVYGGFPDGFGDLINIEEITLSRNKFSGGVSFGFSKLKKLRVLDLSHNFFDGNVPESVGNSPLLLKLDLSSNGFYGLIPDNLVNLQRLEFLDLSFNRFGNYGVPLCLGKMPRLREVHLSGNLLGGHIPEIWENLGGIIGIGFSNMGLIGKIPASMGLHLRSLSYLGLDNNNLEGGLPEEFGSLDFVNEINLENNNLSGRVPFSANFTSKIGDKLRLKGNSGLCVDGDLVGVGENERSLGGQLKFCNKSDIPNAALFKEGPTVLSPSSSSVQVLLSSSCVLLILGWFLCVI